MVRRQLSAKSLPEPLLTYCQLDLYKQISVTFCFKARHFIFEENTCDHTVCQWQPVRICVNVLTRNSRGGESSKTATTLFTGVCIQHSELTNLRPRQNDHHLADGFFKFIFFTENCYVSIQLSLRYVPTCPTDINSALVYIMAWRRTGDKPLSEPMVDKFGDGYMRYSVSMG